MFKIRERAGILTEEEAEDVEANFIEFLTSLEELINSFFGFYIMNEAILPDDEQVKEAKKLKIAWNGFVKALPRFSASSGKIETSIDNMNKNHTAIDKEIAKRNIEVIKHQIKILQIFCDTLDNLFEKIVNLINGKVAKINAFHKNNGIQETIPLIERKNANKLR